MPSLAEMLAKKRSGSSAEPPAAPPPAYAPPADGEPTESHETQKNQMLQSQMRKYVAPWLPWLFMLKRSMPPLPLITHQRPPLNHYQVL
jgi:hypothetical protein